MSHSKFSIDDAFDSDEEEENIRVYGSTKQTPVKGPKVRGTTPASSDNVPLTDNQYDLEHQSDKSLLPSENIRPILKPGQSAYSLGSTWSADSVVATKSFQELRWWNHPKIKQNFKVVLGAISLTAIGLILLIVGIGIVASPQRGWHCLVFFIGGALCLIPGAYHVVYIYLAINNIAGYNLYNLPVFNT